jgi:hypothetical protein
MLAVQILAFLDIYLKIREKEALYTMLLIICSCVFLYFVVAIFKSRIIINDLGIKIDTSGLFPARELQWEDIVRVSDDSFIGLHIYHLIPKRHKKVISISYGTTNRVGLMKQIVQHVTEQTLIDDSIRRLIDKI